MFFNSSNLRVEMRKYKILFDTGEARKLEDKSNHMAKKGWSVDSISGIGFPTGIHGIYALMVREVSDDKTVENLSVEDNADEAHKLQQASYKFFR